MGKYVFGFKGGGMPEGEEEAKRVMDEWMAWYGAMGDAVVDVGNPFGASTSVGGNGTSGLTGYSIVTADSLEDAASKAGGCPILADGGSVEVYEALDM
jgi:hypothetical protein